MVGLGGIMVGIDIVEVKRIEKLVSNVEHAKRLFFEEELEYARANANPAMHLAGFFCVKESVVKALGGGVVREVKVLHDENGSPKVELFGKAKQLLNGRIASVSISHEKEYATAVCFITDK